jgi:hypothetical protein
MTLWQQIVAWFKTKGGVLHCLVVVYLAGLAWFAASPAFHTLIVGLWSKFPSLLQTAIEAVMQILSIYGIGSAAKLASQKAMAKFSKTPEVPHA